MRDALGAVIAIAALITMLVLGYLSWHHGFHGIIKYVPTTTTTE